jgi:hypothetical protein
LTDCLHKNLAAWSCLFFHSSSFIFSPFKGVAFLNARRRDKTFEKKPVQDRSYIKCLFNKDYIWHLRGSLNSLGLKYHQKHQTIKTGKIKTCAFAARCYVFFILVTFVCPYSETGTFYLYIQIFFLSPNLWWEPDLINSWAYVLQATMPWFFSSHREIYRATQHSNKVWKI